MAHKLSKIAFIPAFTCGHSLIVVLIIAARFETTGDSVESYSRTAIG
jgi:hypothetical protein